MRSLSLGVSDCNHPFLDDFEVFLDGFLVNLVEIFTGFNSFLGVIELGLSIVKVLLEVIEVLLLHLFHLLLGLLDVVHGRHHELADGVVGAHHRLMEGHVENIIIIVEVVADVRLHWRGYWWKCGLTETNRSKELISELCGFVTTLRALYPSLSILEFLSGCWR